MSTTVVPSRTSSEANTAPITAQPTRGAALRRTFAGVALDVGLPVGTYYALHALGATDTTALLAGTVAAAVRVAVVAVRSRRLNAFAILMLAVYAVGLAATFIDGDPHMLLIKDSLGTAVVGVAFLVSLVVGHPMILESMKVVPTPHSDDLVRRYATDAAVRRTVRGLTTMWGVGLLVDAAVRVPLVYALPISTGVAVSHALSLSVMVLLAVATGLVVRHARRA